MTALILALVLAGKQPARPADACDVNASQTYRACLWLGQQTTHAEKAARRCHRTLENDRKVCQRARRCLAR